MSGDKDWYSLTASAISSGLVGIFVSEKNSVVSSKGEDFFDTESKHISDEDDLKKKQQYHQSKKQLFCHQILLSAVRNKNTLVH